MPTAPPPTAPPVTSGEGTPAEPEGDIRRGGWILVLVGVFLVLLALFLLIVL